MTDPEALSPEKRSQILHGAAAVFLRDGYEGASMSRIAGQAGVSKGTLYNHFDSKADLFRAYLAQACGHYLRQVLDDADHHDDLGDALTMIGRRMVAMLLTPERRSLYRMVISEAEHFPELARAFYETGPHAVVAAMARWIEAEVGAGRLAAEDTEFAAEQFFALCQTRLWMRYRLHVQDQPSESEVAEIIGGAVATFLARFAVTP